MVSSFQKKKKVSFFFFKKKENSIYIYKLQSQLFEI